MPESVDSIFSRLVTAEPTTAKQVQFHTACVLGGSIAGLLAARVLSDFAEHVVIIEHDDVSGLSSFRPGTPQADQLHILLPAGFAWMERWLTGFTNDVVASGGLVGSASKTLMMFDGQRQAPMDRNPNNLCATRSLVESCARRAVLRLPNVSVLTARVTGLHYRGGAVDAVKYTRNGISGTIESGLTVDAMGRSSKLSDWLTRDGFESPSLERLAVPINYATARFERQTAADLDFVCALATYNPGRAVEGVSIAAATVIENDQWIVSLIGYEPDRPGRTVDQFLAVSAKLPSWYRDIARGRRTSDVITYRQMESRRRHFAHLRNFPARLVSVGDAVASFNPIYGQGMSSAALHASCLASYLLGGAAHDAAATDFFRLQDVVVDAAWGMSAGGDAVRLDAQNGTVVPDIVRQQRWAVDNVRRASLVDSAMATVFREVSYMLRHPAALTDPAVIERAVAVNSSA